MASITSNYTESRCSKDNAALLLIDHQTGTIQLSHEPTPVEFRQAVIALAKVGKIFNLPTIITSNYETGRSGKRTMPRWKRRSGLPIRDREHPDGGNSQSDWPSRSAGADSRMFRD